jgi:cupin fold WbuC family metalloprotein
VLHESQRRFSTYNNKGQLEDFVLLDSETDNNYYGVNIPKNIWHTIICMDNCVLFECKDGPYVPHEEEGMLEMSDVRGKK